MKSFGKALALILIGIIDYLVWHLITGFSDTDSLSLKSMGILAVVNILFIFLILKTRKTALSSSLETPKTSLNPTLNFWIIIPGLTIVTFVGIYYMFLFAWGCSFSSDSSCDAEFYKLITGVIVAVIIIFLISIKRRRN